VADIVFSGPIGPVRTASLVSQIQSDNATCSLPRKVTANLDPCKLLHKPHSFAPHCGLSAVRSRTGLIVAPGNTSGNTGSIRMALLTCGLDWFVSSAVSPPNE